MGSPSDLATSRQVRYARAKRVVRGIYKYQNLSEEFQLFSKKVIKIY